MFILTPSVTNCDCSTGLTVVWGTTPAVDCDWSTGLTDVWGTTLAVDWDCSTGLPVGSGTGAGVDFSVSEFEPEENKILETKWQRQSKLNV